MNDRKPILSDREINNLWRAGVHDWGGEVLGLHYFDMTRRIEALVRERLAGSLRARHSELVERLQRPCFGGYCDCDGAARVVSGEED